MAVAVEAAFVVVGERPVDLPLPKSPFPWVGWTLRKSLFLWADSPWPKSLFLSVVLETENLVALLVAVAVVEAVLVGPLAVAVELVGLLAVVVVVAEGPQ